MNEENAGLEYAQMLEIPVSTVTVVKRKGLFSRRREQPDLKEEVIDRVNAKTQLGSAGINGGLTQSSAADGEALIAQPDAVMQGEAPLVSTEDLSAPKPKSARGGKIAGRIILAEAVAACLIAAGIFVTNMLLPNTAINAFMGGISQVEKPQPTYADFTLTPVTSQLSEGEISVTPEGVICFTQKTSVYPVCDGTITSVTAEEGGAYTVKIGHSESFTSVFTGLDTVYYTVGSAVKGNLPFAYSSGSGEVQVSMYDGEKLLNCYTLSGAVPVWNS